MENRKVQRGEIYLYDFGANVGSIQNGVRPVLIIQSDETNNASTTTIVAAITSVIKKRYLPSHIILGDNFGLHKSSMVMLEQLRTVNQEELTQCIGKIDSEYIQKQLNIGIKKATGLWTNRPLKKFQTVRCLCAQCLNDYKENPEYIIRRLDPFAKVKDECDRCGNLGWDYVIIDREKIKRL